MVPLLLAAAACGPVHATSAIGNAEAALARARAAGSEKLATYDTVLADLYLEKAREEQGHARYSEAAVLATKAVEYADVASNKAAARNGPEQQPAVQRVTIQRGEPSPPPAPTQGTQR